MSTENATTFERIVKQRRSMRIYDQQTEYDKDIVRKSLELAILSPNSSNMQLWEFIRVTSPEAKKKIAHFCLNQSAAVSASEMVIFVARPDKYKQSIQFNLDLIHDKSNFESEKSKTRRTKYYKTSMPLFYMKDFMNIAGLLKKAFVTITGIKHPVVRAVSSYDKKVTIHKSVALAAQTFMLAVKSYGYDTCPMEGFDSLRIKKYLQLPRAAQINMIISVGKGTEEGIFYPQSRYKYDEIVKEV
jgi:nitroreductase